MPDDVPWLDPDETATWIVATALMEALPAALGAQLRRDSGLNLFEYMVLAGLSDAPDRSRPMRDLMLFASGSASRMSHAVKRLEARGWIERAAHPDGGRALTLTLTDAGQSALTAAAPGHVRAVRSLVLDALTPTQVRQLGRISRAVVGRISPDVAAIIDAEAR